MKTKVRIKIGDNVKVLIGKDSGQTGKVEKVYVDHGTVLVENINMVKKHVKPQGQKPGGIISVNKPLKVSNVQLVCPSCKKATRISFEGQGKNKQRICKKCSVTIDEVKKATKQSKKK